MTKSSPPPSSVNRLPNGTIEISLILPWTDIQSAYEKEVDQAVLETELPGFRKGRAPRDLVLPKLNSQKLYTAALQKLIPAAYSKAVEGHQIKPVLYPHIKIVKGQSGSDWELTATTCEAPVVDLPPDYKTSIKSLEIKSPDQKLSLIVDFLRKNSRLKIPDLLIEEEADHRLGQLAENLSQLGLDIPRYLQSKKLSQTDLRAQTATQAKIDLEIEFILENLRQAEKLPDRKQTLDFLASLV